jgi:hypothetical protein
VYDQVFAVLCEAIGKGHQRVVTHILPISFDLGICRAGFRRVLRMPLSFTQVYNVEPSAPVARAVMLSRNTMQQMFNRCIFLDAVAAAASAVSGRIGKFNWLDPGTAGIYSPLGCDRSGAPTDPLTPLWRTE